MQRANQETQKKGWRSLSLCARKLLHRSIKNDDGDSAASSQGKKLRVTTEGGRTAKPLYRVETIDGQ
jgi:hypothetical protein